MRNNRLIILLAALSLLAMTAPNRSLAKIVDSIALIVDQDSMTKGELDEAVQAYFANQQLKAAQPGTSEYAEAKKQVCEGFMREVLLAEEADREKLELQEGEVDHEVDNQVQNMKKGFSTEQEFLDSLKNEGISLDDLKQDIRDKMTRRIKASHLMREKQQELPGSVVVSDSDAKKYYEQHPGDYERVKFSIILLRVSSQATAKEEKQVRNQAEGILKKVRGGADFSELAKKYSEDPGSAADGGEVGTVARADIGDAKLAEGVFALEAPGNGLVRASDGIYVVKVASRGKADFESAASDIKTFLKKQKQDNAINSWIDKLKKNAYIVEDDKVVSSELFMSNQGSTIAGSMASSAPSTLTAQEEKSLYTTDEYPSLPAGGSFIPYVGGQGFLPDTTDLSNFYSNTAGVTSTAQGFPFGLGLYGGIDYALDSTIQAGLMVDGVKKFAESVTVANPGIEQWNSAAVGIGLDVKVLIPMDESTNFILNASGGVYTLVDSSVTVTVAGGTSQGSNLTGTSLGGDAGVGLEFMLDAQKSTALDLGVDYRLLSFNPVTSSNTAGLLPAGATPNNMAVDFSGINVRAGIRFFLGKDDTQSNK